jgi:fibronectin type 3 domain-containing protein
MLLPKGFEMRGKALLLAVGFLFSGLLSTFTGREVRAAEQPAVYLVRGDTVFIWMTRDIRRGWGLDVYRRAPGESEFRKLTKRPVRPAQNPDEMQRILGSSYPWVERALEADNAFQVWRRLQSGGIRGWLLSLLDRRVARAQGRLFADTAATGPGPFLYKIVFVDGRGRSRGSFELKVVKVERLPAAPGNLQAQPGDARAILRWEYPPWTGNPQDMTVQFRVYGKGPGEAGYRLINRRFILREQKRQFEYTVLWLKNNAPYAYYVVAVDALGREGEPSDTVTVVPRDVVPPRMPQRLFAQVDSTTVHLMWTPNVDLDLAGYRVYRALSLGGPYRQVSGLIPAETPYFDDEKLKPGALYFYRVSAVDSAGNESQKSNAYSVAIRDWWAPQPPVKVSAQFTGTGLKIQWEPSPSEDVRGYYVYLGELERQLPRKTLEMLPDKERTYFVPRKDLVPGRTYWLAVTALDQGGNESPQQRIRVEVPDWAAPASPAFLVARSLPDGSVELTWGASMSLDVSGYNLYRNDSLLAGMGRDVHRYRDAFVKKGQTYYYSVAAVDSVGNESERKRATVTPRDQVPPPAPRDVRAKLTPHGVQLTWGRVIAKDLAGFHVYRSDLPTGVFERLTKEPLRVREFLDPVGTARHWYRVRAVDTSGNQSAWKTAVQAR